MLSCTRASQSVILWIVSDIDTCAPNTTLRESLECLLRGNRRIGSAFALCCRGAVIFLDQLARALHCGAHAGFLRHANEVSVCAIEGNLVSAGSAIEPRNILCAASLRRDRHLFARLGKIAGHLDRPVLDSRAPLVIGGILVTLGSPCRVRRNKHARLFLCGKGQS